MQPVVYDAGRSCVAVTCLFKMSDQQMNIIFVGEIEKHECLYNFTLPQYTRKDITEKAWQAVAEQVNLTGRYVQIYIK